MACLGYMAVQDFKTRKVIWFVFPLLMLFFGLLHFLNVTVHEIFFHHVLINFILICCIISILYVYTSLIAKKPFLGHSLGLGDVLFFYALGLGFPPLTFIVLFTSSIIFSLFTFLIVKNGLTLKTVPLAGLMGLYMIFVLLYGLIFKFPTLLYAH